MRRYADEYRLHHMTLRLVAIGLLFALYYYNSRVGAQLMHGVIAYGRGVLTIAELSSIKNQIIQHWSNAGELPKSDDEFERFVRQSYEGANGRRDPLIDRFGHRIVYETTDYERGKPVGFRLRSAGPDGRYRTRDDVVVEWRRPEHT